MHDGTRDRAGVILPHEGGLAVIERRRSDGSRYHVIPGGGIEAGETPRQAAVREAWEELGLVVELPGQAHPLRLETARGVHWYFRAVAVGGVLGDGPDGSDTHAAVVVRDADVAGLGLLPAVAAEAAVRAWLTGAWWSEAVTLVEADPLAGRARAGAIIRREGRVLLIRRQLRGEVWFEIPGGGIDPGETPEETAVRELREETGLEIRLERLLAEVEHNGSAQHYFLASADGPVGPRESLDLNPDATPLWLPVPELADAPVWPRRLAWRIASWSRDESWPAWPLRLSDRVEDLTAACYW